jgi:hypothetical protein
MASPTQLLITMVAGSSPSSVTVNIPTALVALDSGQQASEQTGFSSADQLVRAIFRAGVFTDGQGAWYPTTQIAKIIVQ